jgi:hypothetical protein
MKPKQLRPDRSWGPPSLSHEYRFFSPAVKWPVCGVGHSLPSRAGVKSGYTYISTPLCASVARYGATFAFTEGCIECCCTQERNWVVRLKAEIWKLREIEEKWMREVVLRVYVIKMLKYFFLGGGDCTGTSNLG